jgi:hypothetical protein
MVRRECKPVNKIHNVSKENIILMSKVNILIIWMMTYLGIGNKNVSWKIKKSSPKKNI